MTDLRTALVESIAAEDARAVPYSATRYEVFKVADPGGPFPQRTYARGDVKAQSLDEAVTEALLGTAFSHKDFLLVRETGDRGMKLHLYSIKKRSAPTYAFRDHAYHREHRLYAAHVCSIDGGILGVSL